MTASLKGLYPSWATSSLRPTAPSALLYLTSSSLRKAAVDSAANPDKPENERSPSFFSSPSTSSSCARDGEEVAVGPRLSLVVFDFPGGRRIPRRDPTRLCKIMEGDWRSGVADADAAVAVAHSVMASEAPLVADVATLAAPASLPSLITLSRSPPFSFKDKELRTALDREASEDDRKE